MRYHTTKKNEILGAANYLKFIAATAEDQDTIYLSTIINAKVQKIVKSIESSVEHWKMMAYKSISMARLRDGYIKDRDLTFINKFKNIFTKEERGQIKEKFEKFATVIKLNKYLKKDTKFSNLLTKLGAFFGVKLCKRKLNKKRNQRVGLQNINKFFKNHVEKKEFQWLPLEHYGK
jgi:hypothetical protein